MELKPEERQMLEKIIEMLEILKSDKGKRKESNIGNQWL